MTQHELIGSYTLGGHSAPGLFGPASMAAPVHPDRRPEP
jgi:hypothetical protein